MLQLVTPEPPASRLADERPEFRYWAFLSYSHHDRAIAKRLQKQLETYRVPRRLVGRHTSHGPVPARVSPVFRDRDELHAGADLKASVQEALTRSRWLIVVCTPDAARSPWVNREIIEFKKLHGERRVLALIARGEPFASDMPGHEAQECFPPALRRALNDAGEPEGNPLEPIAADMRREGDGPHRAMLKLLAGMLGVAFDDLVRRDVQRRVRWLTALAASSVLGVFVFAFLAVMAVQARNEAQLQRQQAEGLIEFMLGDLRKKLEPVGRLEVLDSVGEKALAYYGAQEAGKLDATALGHRSRAMHLIGEIRDLRGQPAEAQKAFEQAAETTAKLLAKAPNDGQRIFDHAQSVFWVGYAAWKRGDGRTAEPKFLDYLALAERLAAIDPQNLDWRAELAFAHVNLGTVRLGRGHPTEALASLQAANALLQELVARRPQLVFELAQSRGWTSIAYEALGKYVQALEEQRRKLALFRSMPGGEKNLAALHGVLLSMNAIGHYELAMGRLADAQASAAEALAIADVLLKEDPKNLYWRVDACVAQLKSVEVLWVLGQTHNARLGLSGASACVAQYAASGTRGVRDSLILEARLRQLGLALAADRQGDAGADEAAQFLDRSMLAITPETADRTKLYGELANLALALAEHRVAHRDPEGARVAWQKVERLLEPLASSEDGAILTPLARARLGLGDVSGAQALASRIQLSPYRHPAYADLVKQLKTARGGIRTHETPGERQ